ncbi:MAG: PD-(D/E)XK nuclease family protein [Planctomycetes bacterium]|nr:PD-(D/E)XK nuclease family protein [Planctomycetota bacterium]
MRFTATMLVTQRLCPYLRFALYEMREPLPTSARRRRFGNLLHAAIAAYEQAGRSLEQAIETLARGAAELPPEDAREAEEILRWRHSIRRDAPGRSLMNEGPLRTSVAGRRLDARVDRFDAMGGMRLLAEYKTGLRAPSDLLSTQFTVLAYAAWRVFGQAPGVWEAEFLRARQVVRVPAESDPRVLERRVTELATSIVAGDRQPRPHQVSQCPRCPARAFCPRVTRMPRPFSRTPRVDPQPALL